MSTFNVVFRRASERAAASQNPDEHKKALRRGEVDKSHLTHPDSKIGDALACAFSFDTDLLCVGTSRGAVKLLHATSNFKPASFELTSALCRGQAMNSAIACLRFRPGPDRSTKDLLLVGCTDGTLSEWHLGSVQMVFADNTNANNSEDDGSSSSDPHLSTPNEIYAVDYEPTAGDFFCSTGKNGRLKIYDAHRKANIATLRYTALSDVCDAHSSRVQACKWSPEDPNVVFTAGWDKTVQVWDVRRQRAVDRIYGPYVCGDGLDVASSGSLLVTASTRPTHNLQFWDTRNSYKPICEFDYPIAPSTADDPEPSPSSLFAAKFSPDGRFLATGGSLDYRIFDVKQSLHDKKMVGAAVNEAASSGGGGDDNKESRTIPIFAPAEAGRILFDGGVSSAVFSVAWNSNSSSTAAVGYGSSITVLNKFG